MDEGADSVEEELMLSEEEVDLQALAVRRYDHERRPVDRYSPPNFRFAFVLSTVSDELRSVKEAVNFEDCKLWKKMPWWKKWRPWTKARTGTWLNYLMEGNPLVVNGYSKRN